MLSLYNLLITSSLFAVMELEYAVWFKIFLLGIIMFIIWLEPIGCIPNLAAVSRGALAK